VKTYLFFFYLLFSLIPLREAFAVDASLSLLDAIRIALENNPDIQVEKENIRIREAMALSEAAQFDSALQINTGLKELTRSATSLLETGLTGQKEIEQEEAELGLGWRKSLGWGGEYGLTLSRLKTDSTFQTNHPIYQGDLALIVTQPVLRGFGRTVRQGPLKIAQIEVEISRQLFLARVTEIIQKIIAHYWELVFQGENLVAQQRSLTRAEKLLVLTQTKVKLGLLAQIEIFVAEVSAAKREEAVIIAKKGVQDIEGQLLNLMGRENSAGSVNGLLPIDRPVDHENHFDQKKLFELALKERPEASAQAFRLQSAALSVKISENQTRPSLDFVGAFGQSGIGQNLSDSFDQLSSGDFYRWEAGLIFKYPLGNQMATAAVQKEKAMERLIKIEKEKMIRQIGFDIAEGVRRSETDYQRIRVTRRALDLAQKQHVASEERFRLGLLASHDLIEFQNEVTGAEVNALRAVIDYNKSLANLHGVAGTLLKAYQVDIVPEWKK